MESVRLSPKELEILNNFMKKNNIKNKSQAIRVCIRNTIENHEMNNSINDINIKLNRLIHNQFMTKKLLEQLYVNMGFKNNFETDDSKILQEFYEKNNNYRNNFLG